MTTTGRVTSAMLATTLLSLSGARSGNPAEQRHYLDFVQAFTTALREAWEARAALKRALGDTK